MCADARPATRVKIANSPETRAFLEIGLLLLHDDLLDHRGPDLLADHDAGTRLFAGLSQARLVERAEQEDLALERPKVLTVGMFRDRWRYKSRYTEDLIAYLMRPALLARKLRTLRSALDALPPDITLTDLVREMSRATLAATLEDPLWSLQTIVWVGLPNHPRVKTFLKINYEQLLTNWAELYQQVARRYGLELRPGYTWLDVAEMLNAVTDGARMRAKGMGSVAALSPGTTWSSARSGRCCPRCSPTRTPCSPNGSARADTRPRHAADAAVSRRPVTGSLVVQPLPSLDGARR